MRRVVLAYGLADVAYWLFVKPRLRRSLGVEAHHATTTISYDSAGNRPLESLRFGG